MADPRDGLFFVPRGAARAVVQPGEFPFAAAFLDHGHIYGQTTGLLQAGATLRRVFDPDPAKVAAFRKQFPQAQPAASFAAILDDPAIRLVAAAAVPSERAAVGMQVLAAGKDYFTDKSPVTTLQQLAAVRAAVAASGRKYLVYYAERLHNAPTFYAGELISGGAIGRVLQVLLLAPHNLNPKSRPAWFFDKARYGGILTDIGSHQFEQFLYYAGAAGGRINYARAANLGHPETPGLEDFGEASATLDGGASAYCRVDWFNPAASRTWGDGRAFVLGTGGYLEVRKNVDAGNPAGAPCVILVNDREERVITFDGSEPFPFFGRMILDCLRRTEEAMSQEHAFAAAELSLRAQAVADAANAGRGPDG